MVTGTVTVRGSENYQSYIVQNTTNALSLVFISSATNINIVDVYGTHSFSITPDTAKNFTFTGTTGQKYNIYSAEPFSI